VSTKPAPDFPSCCCIVYLRAAMAREACCTTPWMPNVQASLSQYRIGSPHLTPCGVSLMGSGHCRAKRRQAQAQQEVRKWVTRQLQNSPLSCGDHKPINGFGLEHVRCLPLTSNRISKSTSCCLHVQTGQCLPMPSIHRMT
jgi:hypothetical protein